MHARIDALMHPHFWSPLPSIILDWVVITVSVSLSVDAMKRADTSHECYLEYFACHPHRTNLLLVGACEHYSGCTSLHLRKCIATGVTHHPPMWHTSHMPKSPVYPPPDDSSENAEFSNVPDLETPREQMSPVQDKPKEPDHATHMTVPADANANMIIS